MAEVKGDTMANETGLEEVRERAVAKLLAELNAPHTECEDPWYSCPKSPEGCANDGEDPNICTCGTDYWLGRLNHIANAAYDAGREAEMELCCKDVCAFCRNTENYAPATLGDVWLHGLICDVEDYRICEAAAIRERWAGEDGGVGR